MPTVGPWVQPDDATAGHLASVLIVTQYGTAGTGAANDNHLDAVPTEAITSALGGGSDVSWETVVLRLSPSQLGAPPESPPLPSGATSVEYEAEVGLLLTATINGRLIVTSSQPAFDPISFQVQQMNLADVYPGQPVPPGFFSTGPTHTTSGVPVFSSSGQGTFTFGPLTQSFPLVEQVVAWRFGELNSLQESNPVPDGDIHLVVEGHSTGAPVPVSYTYRPPRYRYIFEGRTPIRGRQRASGVMGSIPLRGRQGDVWGLRGRQNSNL